MYTGDVNPNVEQYPTFVFMQETLAKTIITNNLSISEIFNNIVKLEEIAPYYDMSDYINTNVRLDLVFPMLKNINDIYKDKLNLANYKYYTHNQESPFVSFFFDFKNDEYFRKYVNENGYTVNNNNEIKEPINEDDTNTTQSYELVRSNDGKTIIVIFKPSFKNSLKVRNELNNFILACLEELRSALSNKSNLTRYALFSKVTQL